MKALRTLQAEIVYILDEVRIKEGRIETLYTHKGIKVDAEDAHFEVGDVVEVRVVRRKP